jgi:hypothetical protein
MLNTEQNIALADRKSVKSINLSPLSRISYLARSKLEICGSDFTIKT